MKRTSLTIFFLFFLFSGLYAKSEVDSLLAVLDKTIVNRKVYTSQKEGRIKAIKSRLVSARSLEDKFHLHEELIGEYQSFKCDSALAYVERNIEVAEALNNQEYLHNSRLKQAFVLSLSGLFTPALEVLKSLDYQRLPSHLKVLYCWSYIRYNENLIKYMENRRYEKTCFLEIKRHRDSLMRLLNPDSELYLKEQAFKLSSEKAYQASAELQLALFRDEQPNTHGYAMSAMGLATIYKELGASELEEKYLLLAAITDVQLAVKENESLLALAAYQYEKGDTDRAFNYIQASLEDANFYNSRFRNTVIGRIHPIIEATYLAKIEQQKRNLRLYALALSVFVLILIVTLYLLYQQVRNVSRARKKLKDINDELLLVNKKLDEANLIRERYIGYYINQCAVYLDKLEEYRKYVHRKIKAGQIDDLQKLSASNLVFEQDVESLYSDFDATFFEVYPNFVEQFNELLRADERYVLKKNQLNTELRIFALIRLGITDVNQIATFLRYSIQTIYNYKSKVKSKALSEGDHFEQKVKKIGSFSRK
ncbi:DUF6377 domain-containing protein [Sphingobacterium sp. JB170]|uniref:DUF6377 domain-containing protein n=1 Tax=Sphingobacterium sp. JB170 TaxID=1434842 RepID=UPI00097E8963|nr:DUF6377 domain-containing protein [Sphingobacterium sp. JB170]SJN47062.1 Regulatory protein SusR [Sphingobacterium sp. JB170]